MPHQANIGKGQMGSALMGSLQSLCFLTGTLWVFPLIDVYIPKSARAHLFPQSVKNGYFCSGPISVDPICPQPIMIMILIFIIIITITTERALGPRRRRCLGSPRAAQLACGRRHAAPRRSIFVVFEMGIPLKNALFQTSSRARNVR